MSSNNIAEVPAEIMSQNAHVDDFSMTESESSSFDSVADQEFVQPQTESSNRRGASKNKEKSSCTPLKAIFAAGALLAGAGCVAVFSGACSSESTKPASSGADTEAEKRDVEGQLNPFGEGEGPKHGKAPGDIPQPQHAVDDDDDSDDDYDDFNGSSEGSVSKDSYRLFSLQGFDSLENADTFDNQNTPKSKVKKRKVPRRLSNEHPCLDSCLQVFSVVFAAIVTIFLIWYTNIESDHKQTFQKPIREGLFGGRHMADTFALCDWFLWVVMWACFACVAYVLPLVSWDVFDKISGNKYGTTSFLDNDDHDFSDSSEN